MWPKTVNVLHIDDSLEFRGTAEFLLNKSGYIVQGARDGAEAHQLAHSTRFFAILTDSSGIVAAQQLAANDKKMVLIVLSGNPPQPGIEVHAWIEKRSNWQEQVVMALTQHLAPRESSWHRLDVFAQLSSQQLDHYRGKVLLLTGQPENVVGVADSLADAEALVLQLSLHNAIFRFVPGLPLASLTLADLEA